MSMEDIMKALMQSSGGTQQPSSSGGLGTLLGGLLGGGQSSAGGAALAQAIGGALGGSGQGSAGVTQLLGGLQQIIGGTPGSGQLTQGAGAMPSANDPVMLLLQPVVNQLAAKANISPQIAMVVASIAVHYLLQSHPSTPGSSPLNLGNVMQQLASGGGIDQSTLQKSGMVNDVVQATGLKQDQAVKTLNTTFNVLGGRLKGAKAGVETTPKSKKKK